MSPSLKDPPSLGLRREWDVSPRPVVRARSRDVPLSVVTEGRAGSDWSVSTGSVEDCLRHIILLIEIL